MHRKHLSVAALLASAFVAAARSAPAQNGDGAAVLPLYLEVRAASSDAETQTFASKLLEFALGSVSGVQLRAQASPCAVFARGQTAQARSTEPDGTRFAVVRLALEERRPEGRAVSEWLVDYEVAEGRWAASRAACAEPLMHQTQRTSQARLVDTLAIVSKLMASAITPWIQTSQTSVVLTVSGNDQIKDELTALLTSRIGATRDFTVAPASAGSAYALQVDIGTTNPLLKAVTLSVKSEVIAKITVRGRNATATTTQLPGRPPEELPELYRTIAETAIRQLYEARAASDLSLASTKLQGVSDAQLVAQARTLLCIEPPQSPCTMRPDEALAVLRRLPKDVDVATQLLRGRAQLAALQGVDAGQTFDKAAADATATVEQQLQAFDFAGDAYVSAKSYDEAIGRYGKWLGLAATSNVAGPRASAVAMKRAHAQRIRHAFDEAVDSLFQALAFTPEVAGADAELSALVRELSKPQLTKVLTQLAAQRQPARFRAVRVAALRTLASLDAQSGAYPSAETSLISALADDDSQRARVDLAWLYYRWAMAGSGDRTPQDLLQRGVGIVAPAVSARIDDADNAFMNLNHQLSNDVASRQEFERIAFANPNDGAALMSIMYVCTEYLNDFPCSGDAARRLVPILEGRPDVVRQVSVLEVQVLNADFDAAATMAARLMSLPSRGNDYRYVQLFYAAWINLATGKRDAATKWANDWRREMETLRKGSAAFDWIFGGARKGLAASTRLSQSDAAYLRSMMDAMEDARLQVPPPFGS